MPQQGLTHAAEWKPDYVKKGSESKDVASKAGLAQEDAVVLPDYSMRRGELLVSSHMADFVDCVRTRALPRCHVDRAFEGAVALLMSVEAYTRERKVKWDPAREMIV